MNSKIRNFLLRVALGMGVGILFGWLLSNVSSFYTSEVETGNRDPQQIVLVIPYGTAEQVDQGIPVREIPTDISFVEGDILVVKNEDKVPHQLGPLFVPPNTSSVLNLEKPNTYSFACSFEPTKFIGLTVLPRVTGSTRVQAILAIGLPTGMMLAVYSYLLPDRKKKMTAG